MKRSQNAEAPTGKATAEDPTGCVFHPRTEALPVESGAF
jgi:hypothetical protein